MYYKKVFYKVFYLNRSRLYISLNRRYLNYLKVSLKILYKGYRYKLVDIAYLFKVFYISQFAVLPYIRYLASKINIEG